MAMRYRKSPYAARAIVRSSLRQATLNEIGRQIRQDIKSISQRIPGDSLLRNMDLTRFSWDPILKELKKRAPVVFTVLKAAFTFKSRAKTMKRLAFLVSCTK